jgi:hypothetical protein
MYYARDNSVFLTSPAVSLSSSVFWTCLCVCRQCFVVCCWFFRHSFEIKPETSPAPSQLLCKNKCGVERPQSFPERSKNNLQSPKTPKTPDMRPPRLELGPRAGFRDMGSSYSTLELRARFADQKLRAHNICINSKLRGKWTMLRANSESHVWWIMGHLDVLTLSAFQPSSTSGGF